MLDENTSFDILIEVCCGSVDDAVEAAGGGAARIELNSSLFFDGSFHPPEDRYEIINRSVIQSVSDLLKSTSNGL
ncbi:MAG: hypothetical protein JXM79_01490 [Sedimentisphaerales bacterium]|nr:hypothetical protein [Sedimentisphaerales bacterium]